MKTRLGFIAAVLLLTGCPSTSRPDSGFGGGFFAGGGLGGNGGGFGGGGGSATGGGSASGGGSSSGGGTGGGGTDTLGPLAAHLVVAPLNGVNAFGQTVTIDPTSHRLYSFPPVASADLSFVTTVRMVGDGATLPDGGAQSFVEALPVTGSVTEGMTQTAAVDPGSGELVAVLWSHSGTRFEVASMKLTQGEAHFTAYASVNAPSSQYAATQMAAITPGQFLVQVGNFEYVLTLASGTATWSAPMQPMSTRYPERVMRDGPRGREIGFSEHIYDAPPATTYVVKPTVFTRALPGGVWTEVSTSGTDAPPIVQQQQAGAYISAAAWDDVAQKLIVAVIHQIDFFGTMEWVYGMWSCDLTTGGWTKLADDLGPGPIYWDPITDPANQQVITSLAGSWANLLSYSPSTAGTASSAMMDGQFGAQTPHAAAALADGRLVQFQGYLFSWTAADPVWRKLGDAQPPPINLGPTLSYDAQTNKLLLYGGALNSTPSAKLYEVAQDGSAFTELSTTNAPPAHSGHSAIAHDGVLYIAGGSANADVWALDLTQLSWRQLGTLPQNRQSPALAIIGHELWVAGGVDPTQYVGIPSIVAFDLTTGASHEVVADNAWPQRKGAWWSWVPLGDGLAAIDSGDVVGDEASQMWTLEPNGSGGAHFTQSLPDVNDYALNGLVGVAGDRHHAWFVGSFTWAVSR